jgi:hypothetical protein
MTFSVAQFRKRADANETGYFVPDTSRGGYRVAPDREWAGREPRWQKWASNRARQAFVESLARDFGKEMTDSFLSLFLPDEGTPLSSRDVIEIIDVGEAYRKIDLDNEAPELVNSLAEHLNAPTPAPLPPRAPPFKINDKVTGFPYSGIQKGKERDLNAAPPPAPSQGLSVPVDPKVQRQGGRREPLLARNRAEQQRSAEGKKPEEILPRVEAPTQRQYSAKELKRAKDALYKSFKAIERHAKNGTTRLALEDQDKALADLLSKANRPDCKSLDERIFELTGERTSLAIHWDLPKKMRSWVELILNATSRGDAAQIELEMRLHLEQLDKDVALLEKALAGKPVLRRTALNEALRQLKSMREQLESSEPWTRLGAHLQAMRDVLPPEPLPIKDPYIAEKRLEKLGISRKAGEDPVHLANEMVRAHNLLRDARLRDPNSSWTRVHEANPQHGKILDKYRNRRLDHIEEAVNRRSTGKAQIKFDRTKQTYTIATKDVGYRLQAFGQLRAIAWQIGGAPNLLTALGYDESDPSEA